MSFLNRVAIIVLLSGASQPQTPGATPSSSNQRSLVVLYGGKNDGGTRHQIGAVSYPDGKFRTITNDTNHYVGLSLSAGADGLVSVVSKTTATIEV